MTNTNTFATPEEIEELKRALATPIIALQCGIRESPQQTCHRLALAHGLPKIAGCYGVDLRTGEFVQP